jgi:CPA1 family monovalent cation:H+ antiporter
VVRHAWHVTPLPPGVAPRFHRDPSYLPHSRNVRTLTIQGLSFVPDARLNSLHNLSSGGAGARIELADVAHRALEAHSGPEADLLRRQLQAQRAAAAGSADGEDAGALRIQALRRFTVDERRGRLLELRRTGVIGDDAFHRLEEELDLADLDRNG